MESEEPNIPGRRTTAVLFSRTEEAERTQPGNKGWLFSPVLLAATPLSHSLLFRDQLVFELGPTSDLLHSSEENNANEAGKPFIFFLYFIWFILSTSLPLFLFQHVASSVFIKLTAVFSCNRKICSLTPQNLMFDMFADIIKNTFSLQLTRPGQTVYFQVTIS